MVDEAHRLGRPVAAHAVGKDGIEAALRAGVNTIEHGYGITDSLAQVMAQRGVYWCPTIYVNSTWPRARRRRERRSTAR